MNQSDGDKALSNERKKLLNKKKIGQSKHVPDSGSSTGGSSGLHSFFRWFRKDKDPDLELPEVVNVAHLQRNFAAGAVHQPGSSGGVTKPKATNDSHSECSLDEVSQSQSNGTHSSSPSPSPQIECNNLSKSSSCDSILSTATTGFAFVPPNCYEAVSKPTERVINPGPYTDSYKRRVRERDRTRELDKKYELTLRKKYKLFANLRETASASEKDATLTRANQKTVYVDLSLPTAPKGVLESSDVEKSEETKDIAPKKHRRTVSDSSKDKRAGAYVHVKGKRRAPPPPPLNLNANTDTLTNRSNTGTLTNSNYSTLSPGSTLSRKKRPAPPPPVSPVSPTLNEASSYTSLFEDKEIKAIIEGTPLPRTPDPTMPMRITPLPGISEERTPGGLTEEQKQQLIDNIRKVQAPPDSDPPTPTNNPPPTFMLTNNDVMKLEENFINTNGTRSPIHDYLYSEAIGNTTKPNVPTSPISPRPWYKRPISGTKHQESTLPFKKDIILKTIDKRKSKLKDKEDLPEVGYCRNSLVDSGSAVNGPKFNLFAKIVEKSDDTKRRERDNEKRKSGIGIPSISELDREAAEIINKENAAKLNEQQTVNELYFSAPEQLVKRSQSFMKKEEQLKENSPESKPRSTKDLISKFEANSTNINKVTVNTSFVPKRDYFGAERKETSPVIQIPSIVVDNGVAPPHALSKTGSDKNLLGLWSCPYCTLENPNWRIICEACERIKPYDKLSILEEPPLRPNHPLKKAIPEPKAQPDLPPPTAATEDWDKKTERVMKYFMPKPTPTMGNGSLAASEVPKKSFGQAKMLASPKMGIKSLMNGKSPPERANGFRNFNSVPEGFNSCNKFDDEKLKENAVIVTTTPVLIAPLVSPEIGDCRFEQRPNVVKEAVDLEEVRSARIARFSTHLDSARPSSPTDPLTGTPPSKVAEMDDQALEREKERLREMIRAMNAKALADKYPVLQKPPTSSGPSKRESPLVQRRNGLVSGIPVSTKSPKPMRKASPTMARRPAPVEEHPPVVAEPYKLGAIRKTFIRKPEEAKPINKLMETKIINKEIQASSKNIEQSSVIPETVNELSEPQLVLANDVQKVHYVAMDEQQFKTQQTHRNSAPVQNQLSDQQNEKVRQISRQLRSAQGVENFKNTLKYAGMPMNRSNTLAINKLLRSLEIAIGDGAHDRAAKLAMDLAKMKVSLSVTRQSPGGSDTGSTGSLTEICISFYINDKSTRKGPMKISLPSHTTLLQLKEKINKDFGIPVQVQRWIYKDRQLCEEHRTLSEYGMQDSDQALQLFIVNMVQMTPKESGVPLPINKVKVEQKTAPMVMTVQPQFSHAEAKMLTVSDSDGECSDTQNDLQGEDESILGATALPTIMEDKGPQNDTEDGWACPLCTLINPPNRPGCGACSESRPTSYVVPARYQTTEDDFIPEELKRFIEDDLKKPTPAVQLRNMPKETRNDLNRVSSNRKSSDIFNILLDENKATETHHTRPNTSDLLTTRHIQVPEQKNIIMTAFTSPNITRNKYRGVDNFNPNTYNNGNAATPKADGPIITTASPIVRAVLLKENPDKPVKFGRNGLVMPEDDSDVTNHYMELVNLDSADLIANVDPFECPICFGQYEQYDGIVLRDCLHTFCKECLVNTINYSEEAEIKCPYMDNAYSCESVIQQREIKSLVTKDMYEAHLAKSIRQAESKLDNTFHCKTPNCRGWCIYEDNVNQFKCPVCTIVNCLTCRAIHDGLDCKQYQDRLNSDCDTNIEARRTKAVLQEMVDRGDAIVCPTCQVVMMKKWGCDWLKCSMCKTEICWVTRGPRWGPGGKGDTSGGCRCGIDGKKCHPKCKYCH